MEIKIKFGNQEIKTKSNIETINDLVESGFEVEILKPKKENEN